MKYFGLLLFCLLLPSLQAQSLQYTISPVFNNEEEMIALQVVLEWQARDSNYTHLQLPDHFAGITMLYQSIGRLRCTGATILSGPDASWVQLVHAPGALLRVQYEVRQTAPGEYPKTGDIYRPVIQADLFQVLGAALFVVPAGEKPEKILVEWKGFPQNWCLANSYGNGQIQEIAAIDNRWLQTIFIGGKGWQMHHQELNGNTVDLAMQAAAWTVSSAEMDVAVNDALGCLRTFWNDMEVPYYLVVVSPVADRHLSGLALEQSIVVFSGEAELQAGEDLLHLLYHEMTHYWIGGKIRNGGAVDDMQLAWFSEGFTEYFSWAAMLQCSAVDSEYYKINVVDRLEEELRGSPYTGMRNEEVARQFFTDPDIRRLPYLRGFMLARELDQLIRQHSKGQRNLKINMQELQQYLEAEHTSMQEGMGWFLKKINRETGGKATKMKNKFIVD